LQRRDYYLRNNEKVSKSNHRWKEKNPDKVRQYHRNKRLKNPALYRLLDKRNKELRDNMEGSHTELEWEELKRKYGYRCSVCGNPEPFLEQPYKWLTEDHVIPVTKGGTDYISNIKPMCMKHNSKKWNKITVVNTILQTAQKV
jgi:hypothetical protein